jgi:hypothetical protein
MECLPCDVFEVVRGYCVWISCWEEGRLELMGDKVAPCVCY